MAKGREKAPAPMVVLDGGRLAPATALDAEIMAGARPGTMYDLVERKRPRSDLQLKWYWALLNKIVDATGAWPNAEILHDLLVKESGFVTRVLNPFTGRWEIARDSFAMNAMTSDEANAYVDTAIRLLTEALAFDVTSLLPPRPTTAAAA